MNEGRIVSNRGLDIAAREYDAHFEEIHVPHSTALQSRLRDRGALSRRSARPLQPQLRAPVADRPRGGARAPGSAPTCANPFQSIVVRAVEVLYACDEALRIIDVLRGAATARGRRSSRGPATGYAATEAPRGLLYHRYRLDGDGAILDAKIVPPTSQNQPSIEEDLMTFVDAWLDLPDDELRHRCEQAVRNYDPCISCATHFLDLRVDRGEA